MKNRFFAGIAALTLLSSLLSGCHSPSQVQLPETTVPEESNAPVQTAPAVPTAQEQIQLLMDLQKEWNQEYAENGLPSYYYYYAVTDLDWNGRLELIVASTQGTGIFTYGTVYEISEDFASIQACELTGGEGTTLPEIILDSVPAAYDPASETYYYVFKDDYRVGMAEYGQTIMPLSLKNGVVTCDTLAQMHAEVVDDVTHEEYSTPDKEITAAEYEAVISDFQAKLEGFTANFEWFSVSGDANETDLNKSFEAFQASRNQ